MRPRKDLTQGAIVPQLSLFAVPLLIGNLLQQLYNAIDSIIVGQYMGESAFAAIGVAGTVMNIYIFVLVGFCTGFSILFATHYGAGEYAQLRHTLVNACGLGCGLALVGGVGGIALMKPLLRAIHTPENIIDDVAAYLRVILLGLLFTFLYNFFAAALRSIGSSTSALIFLLLATVIHILLAFLFVGRWGMGVWGVALATVISQAISVVCCVVYTFRVFPQLCPTKEDLHWDLAVLSECFRFGVVSALQSSSLYIGKLLIQSAINPLGEMTIAAYSAATRLEDFLLAAGESCSASLTVFMAQNRGAGQVQRAFDGFKLWQKIMTVGSATLALLMIWLHPVLLPLISATATAESIAISSLYLRTVCLFHPLGMYASAFVGYFRGVGLIRVPFWGTTLQITIRVICAFLLAPMLSLQGVAIATGIGWAGIIVFQWAVYRKNAHLFNPPGAY